MNVLVTGGARFGGDVIERPTLLKALSGVDAVLHLGAKSRGGILDKHLRKRGVFVRGLLDGLPCLPGPP